MKAQCDYDDKADVLYISFGKPKKAICIEKSMNVLMRFDPITNDLVGITIVNAMQQMKGEGL